ncbi:MAG: hypothetical protein ABEK29_11030 [Bradymonadaceae bacterium]
MQPNDPSSDPVLHPIGHFDGARDYQSPNRRVRELKSRAQHFRDEMLDCEPVTYFRSVELVRVPYPTQFAFLRAVDVPTPYLHLCNWLFVVQFRSDEGLKTLLVSPSDPEGNAETPFFKRLAQTFGRFEEYGRKLVSPIANTVEGALAEIGIRPAEVDYLTYDHLHTQDIRKWLGTHGDSGYFPNAKLLVTTQEWASAHGKLPPQHQWYCPQGTQGVDPDDVIAFDGDLRLGDSVALVRTPGHTEGNHSIVTHTPEGLTVTSENGVGPDAYAPLNSEIPGLREYAETTGMEVILNGNTLERGIDQYISMILEKEIAGQSIGDLDFPNMVCSSEFDSYWLFPGISPTFKFGDLEFGRPQTQKARAAQ